MATDTAQPTILSRDVAEFVVALTASPDPVKVLEAWVAQVPLEELHRTTLRSTGLRAILDRATKLLEQRISSEWMDTGPYVDPDTHTVYDFRGSIGDWKYADPEGLKAALLEAAGADALEVAECFELKVKTAELNRLRDRLPDYAAAITEFRTRAADGPPHLVARPEKKR